MKHLDPKPPPASLDVWLRRVGVADAFAALAALVPNAGVIVVDGERRVLHWSPEAERLLGTGAATVHGRACPTGLLCDDDGAPRPFGSLVRLPRPDGSTVLVRQYTRFFAGPEGMRGAIHLLAHDGRAPDVPANPVAAGDAVSFHGLVSRDPAMLLTFDTIRNVAETDTTVLVRGESGTGKELVARAIHLESGRRTRAFVAVNCASLTPTLLESELFGHVKGAFTGAVATRLGIFAQADGGTLFLDEIAEIPMDLQAKLLRVLQERTFVPVGGTEPQKVDVRVIAATHRALREEVRAGRFREDLLYRLRVVPLFLPSLRERRVDVELLLHHFLARYNVRGPRHISRIAPDAMRALLDHAWPGNVRELQNVVEYAFAVSRGEELTLDGLPPEFREARATPTPAPRPAREDGEAQRIERALAACGGDVTRAAEMIGVSRTTFWRMRRRAGV
jgi:transcriptional regulator with PAS, ATPase and Fis domain